MTFPIKKTLRNRRAVVIGGNVAGLCAAVALAVRGARVIVIEERSEEQCQLGQPWPPVTASPNVLAELFAGAEQRVSDFVELDRRDPLCRLHIPEHDPVDLHTEPGLLAGEIARIDKQDAERLAPFLARCARAWNGIDRVGRELQPLGDRKARALQWMRSEAATLSRGNFARHVRRTFRHPAVVSMILSLGSIAGFHTLGGTAHGLARLGEFHQHGGWHIRGGHRSVHDALVRLCGILRIRILHKCRAERIELDSGRVRRITGRGFKPITASIVVSAARPAILRSLLPDGEEASAIDELLAQAPPREASIRYRFTVEDAPKKLSALNIICPTNALEEARQREQWWVPPVDPAIVVAMGKVGDVMALDTFHRLPPVTRRFVWTADHLEEEESLVLERISRAGIDDLRSLVTESECIAAPGPNVRGDARAPLRRLRLSQHAREVIPQRLAIIPGLYCCGAGGGVQVGAMADAAFRGLRAATLAGEDA